MKHVRIYFGSGSMNLAVRFWELLVLALLLLYAFFFVATLVAACIQRLI